MSEAIYAPPKADIAVPVEETAEFYVIAPRKFYLLSVLTLNLYLAYWFWRNWRAVKRREGSDIWPVARAFFHIFFTHSLFAEIDEALRRQQASPTSDTSYKWRPRLFATLYVVGLVVSSIAAQVSSVGIGSPYTDLTWLGFALVAPLFILPAQRAANVLAGDVSGSRNRGLTLANWLWMIGGSLYWIVVLLGLYVMLVQPEWLVE